MLIAFLVVWLPMTGLGVLSHVVPVRAPAWYLRLRPAERSGVLYRRLGVGVAKRALRRGPLSVFNPGLHLPAERTRAQLRVLDRRMCEAESAHALLLVLELGVAGYAAARGWWTAAGWIVLFNILINGYPVMLQRSNRAWLRRRFGPLATDYD